MKRNGSQQPVAVTLSMGLSHLRGFWLLAALALLAPGLGAQNFSVDRHVIAGGGGSSNNAQFSVSGTIGQFDAGIFAGADFSVEGGFWNLEVPAQLPDGPVLLVKQAGATVEVFWASSSSAFGLQETSSLGDASQWTNTAAAPSVINGQWVVRLPVQSGMKFFRLRLP